MTNLATDIPMKKETRNMLGLRLMFEREKLGLTQGELAERLGIHRVSQSNYERGATSPDVKYLAKADEIGIDVYYVLTGKTKT
jgi:transcriptional regulator with XRE-family HTH domain